ncbi:MAG TPA: hypothetical protein VMY42_13550, partial [Thermoguttaceae bacterium]|nr:hypothetical protein [Thermoguttaceae bacterium]
VMPDLTVATVLRSGGVYGPEWVTRLRRQVARHLHLPHRFVCLTDVPDVPCDTVPLTHGWPHWWSKLELWRPGILSGRVIYFDLDTLITGPIAALSGYRGALAVLADFLAPQIGASGVMLWDTERTAHVWKHIENHPPECTKRRSDYYLAPVFKDADRIQPLFPGLVGSYKADKLTAGPGDFGVVCFHGRPKMEDLPKSSWARKWWLAHGVRREQGTLEWAS